MICTRTSARKNGIESGEFFLDIKVYGDRFRHHKPLRGYAMAVPGVGVTFYGPVSAHESGA
jgi:hypothetical protein